MQVIHTKAITGVWCNRVLKTAIFRSLGFTVNGLECRVFKHDTSDRNCPEQNQQVTSGL